MNKASENPVRYKSYLLRMRCWEQDGQEVRQVMLQAIPSGQQRYFSDMQALVQFLQPDAPRNGGAHDHEGGRMI